MKLIGRDILSDFGKKHAEVRDQIEAWTSEIETAEWQTPLELRERYPRATYIKEGRWVFDIKGNEYRIDARVNFQYQIVRVLRMGTHADYDKWAF